jgi:sigma-B regulation protein RsbU (phosphoserine phosphatase)
LKPKSVSTKLILSTSGLIALVVVLYGYFHSRQIESGFQHQSKTQSSLALLSMRERARNIVQLVGLNFSTAILENEWSYLETQLLPVVQEIADLESGRIADKSGKILITTVRNDTKKTLDVTEQLSLVENETQVKFLAPITATVNKETHSIGAVEFIFSKKRLLDQLDSLQKEESAQKKLSDKQTAIIGLIALIVGIVISIAQGLMIGNPLRRLTQVARDIAAGNLEARATTRNNDEIGELCTSFNDMAANLQHLMVQAQSKAEMEKELEVARAIQETLIPPVGLLSVPGVSFAGLLRSASECGGDWWGYQKLSQTKTLFIVGDVTGHGVSSAMITASAKSCIDTLTESHQQELTVAALLDIMNRTIFQVAHRKLVMTCFAAIYDSKSGVLEYANAGHNLPYVLRRSEQNSLQLGQLVARGNRLGDLWESKFESKRVQLKASDMLFLYTDGLIECENKLGKPYGERRMRRQLLASSNLSPDVLVDTMLEGFYDFVEDCPPNDDITLLAVRITA